MIRLLLLNKLSTFVFIFLALGFTSALAATAVDIWKKKLSNDKSRFIESILYPELRKLGYSTYLKKNNILKFMKKNKEFKNLSKINSKNELNRLNYFFQKHVTKGATLRSNSIIKIINQINTHHVKTLFYHLLRSRYRSS